MEKIKFNKTHAPIILIGDVIDKLQELKKENIKVDTIITSPPYWGQRDYGVQGQLGNEKTTERYIENMLKVADNLRDVLKDSGSFFLNIGDKYTGKNLKMIPFRVATEMQSRGWVLRNIIMWYKPNHMPSPIKDRLNNVYEPIFFFVKDTGNNYTPRYYVNLDEIRVEHKNGNSGGNRRKTMSIKEFEKLNLSQKPNGKDTYKGKFAKAEKINLGASPGARSRVNGEYWSLQRKYEINDNLKREIITFLKKKLKAKKMTYKDLDKIFGYKDTAGHWFRLDRGGSLPKVEDYTLLKGILGFNGEFDKVMTEQHYVLQQVIAHPKGKNPGDFWSIPLEKMKDSHFAIFPTELPLRIISAFCPKDGIVLDPFAGSGTTGKAAKELKRKSILIDINKDYLKIMKKRCEIISYKGKIIGQTKLFNHG
jgi:DNA modification methylase